MFGLLVDYASTGSVDFNTPDGVLVRDKDLEAGSPAESKLKDWAAQARLIVTAVNGKPVATPAEFYKEAAGKPSVRLTVVEAGRRGGRQEDVTLP